MPARPASAAKQLTQYRAKRNFEETPEPSGDKDDPHDQLTFVVQEHHATRLHYDFRLEADGVLKSWAVTKEPSLDPAIKRLAVRVEDHPLAYAGFSGTIPEGHYGAGRVDIWDRGTYRLLDSSGSLSDALKNGRVSFSLDGKKLKGRFSLVRMSSGAKGNKKENWLLIKGRDEFAERTTTDGPSPAVRKAARKAPSPGPSSARSSAGPAPEEVEITHPEKVLFPEPGLTKADVAAYYRKIAPHLLPFLRDRPVTLERLPDGLGEGKPHFWQKNTPPSYPSWIPRVELDTEGGKPVRYVLVNDEVTLLFLVNQGALTFHPWLSRVGSLDHPDMVLFDLDPGEAAFDDVITVARQLHDELKAAGKDAVVKTSGKTGLHVLVRWSDRGGYDDAREWALAVARRVGDALPRTATVEIRKAKRAGRVYIDVLQNARGHHAVPPYVIRAVPQATVSTPLRWDEIKPGLDPGRFTPRTLLARIRRVKQDPMAAILPGR